MSINFLHFADESGKKHYEAKLYAGMIFGEQFDDIMLSARVADGKIKLEIDDEEGYYKDMHSEMRRMIKNIDWDGGYEFVIFYGKNEEKLRLVGNRNSEMSDMIYSDENISNIKKTMKKLKS